MKIKNILLQEAIDSYFLRSPTNLSFQQLVIMGKSSTTQEFISVPIRILACLQKPFLGPHLVQIQNQDPFWVVSLTAFKRKFFDLNDKLSFERSIFLPVQDTKTNEQQYIRLKNIRCILQIDLPHPDTFLHPIPVFLSPQQIVHIIQLTDGKFAQQRPPPSSDDSSSSSNEESFPPPTKRLKIHSNPRIGPKKLQCHNLKICQQLLNAYSRVYTHQNLRDIADIILKDVTSNLETCIQSNGVATSYTQFLDLFEANEISIDEKN